MDGVTTRLPVQQWTSAWSIESTSTAVAYRRNRTAAVSHCQHLLLCCLPPHCIIASLVYKQHVSQLVHQLLYIGWSDVTAIYHGRHTISMLTRRPRYFWTLRPSIIIFQDFSKAAVVSCHAAMKVSTPPVISWTNLHLDHLLVTWWAVHHAQLTVTWQLSRDWCWLGPLTESRAQAPVCVCLSSLCVVLATSSHCIQ